jgi:hypothetical protein
MKTAQTINSGQINHLFRPTNQSIIEIDPTPFRNSTSSAERWGGSSTTIDAIPFIGSANRSVIDKFSSSKPTHYLSSSAYTNSILNSTYSNVIENPYTAIDVDHFEEEKLADFSTYFALDTLPLFFGNSDLVKVPSKIIYAITRHIPKKVLKQVHPDQQVAIELCLMFASQLTSTYFEVKTGSNPTGWKSLNSKYLLELVGVDSTCYKRIRTVLEYKLENGAIIVCDNKRVSGQKNYHYKFGSWYIDKSVHACKLKTHIAKKFLLKHYLKAFARASENIVCRNLFNFYINLQLPSIEEIELEATRLIKQGFKNKKGKILTRRNKHSNSYFKNYNELTFVEDAIEIYNYLTNEKGIRIPTIGGDASGGRIVDSFTLMPSWIRNMVTINGKRLVESDYTCLHPNIAMHLYGGNSQFLTHEDLAVYLGMDVKAVKKEHLSFFNKPLWQMKESPLWRYYQENEPWMLSNLINEKLNNNIEQKKDKHKMTSMRLFKKEVEIMTDAIEILNQEGIYVMYVYDALCSEECHKQRVQQVMNEVIIEHGVYTQVKA